VFSTIGLTELFANRGMEGDILRLYAKLRVRRHVFGISLAGTHHRLGDQTFYRWGLHSTCSILTLGSRRVVLNRGLDLKVA